MAITINGDTGLTLPASSSITGSSTTLTGITSVASNAADTPVILQDSSSNSATCRAWVNFNGTGTPAINADFNVSSITDNGTGDYTVNFTTAMPDSNYSIVGGANYQTGTSVIGDMSMLSFTTTSVNIVTGRCQTASVTTRVNTDFSTILISVFR